MVRNELGLTTVNLNRHLAMLVDTGYVDVTTRDPGAPHEEWVAI